MIIVCASLSDEGVFGERLSHLLNCSFIIEAKCKQHLFIRKFALWGEAFFNEEQN